MARLRRITNRRPSPQANKRYNDLADRTLAKCEQIWEDAGYLDTAVRDTIADGIAYLLYSAYDCRAVALGLKDEEFVAYPGSCVAAWFRQRGFAEWYCLAAANLFRTSRPRVKAENLIVIRRRKAS